jgi:hypothetical protein
MIEEPNNFWNEKTLYRSLPSQEHIEAMLAEAEEANQSAEDEDGNGSDELNFRR